MSHKVICINRLCGSGGHIIGKMVADELGIAYYDHNLLDLALEYGDLKDSKGLKSFLKSDEKAPNKAFYKLHYEGNDNVEKERPAEDIVFQLQRDIIRRFTQEEDCVIVGRCANIVLESEDVSKLSVFVTASQEYRIQSIMQTDNMNKITAKRHVALKDKQRKNYYSCYTKQDWLEPVNYDMLLNSEKLGFDKCKQILCDYYKNVL